MKRLAKWAGIGLVTILGLGVVGSLLGDPVVEGPKVLPTWTPTVGVGAVATWTSAPPTAVPEAVTLATETPLPTPVPSFTPEPTSAPAATVLTGPRVTGAANLRAGPGTGFDVVGSAAAGDGLVLAGRSGAGDWYQLTGGAWVAAFLVEGVTGDLPVVAGPTAVPVSVPLGDPATPVVVIIPTAAPVVGACSCGGDSLNCGDFSTHNDAQACFDFCMSQGRGDVHKLDGADGDNLACESLP